MNRTSNRGFTLLGALLAAGTVGTFACQGGGGGSAVGAGDMASAAQAVYDLANNNGAPVALKDLGLTEPDLDRACDLALQNQYPNPRPLERQALRQLLQNAFEGNRP